MYIFVCESYSMLSVTQTVISHCENKHSEETNSSITIHMILFICHSKTQRSREHVCIKETEKELSNIFINPLYANIKSG